MRVWLFKLRKKLAFIGGGINSNVGKVHFSASQMDGLWSVDAGIFSRNINDSKKIGTKFLGKKIHGLDLLENDNRNLIISAVQSFDDIYSLILDKKRNNQNILCGLVI